MPEKEGQSSPQQAKPEPKFNQEQYDLLKRCSDRKDMTEWHEWRRQHPKCEVLLEGADLHSAYLVGANLDGVRFAPDYPEHVGRDEFIREHKRQFANLESADLREVRLQGAVLNGCNLKEARMSRSCLGGASFLYANLQKAVLLEADLPRAVLEGADLKGAEISRTDLRNANLRTAIVDQATSIWKPKISPCRGPWRREAGGYTGRRNYTDFQGVPLESIRIDPATKQLLEYNIRRTNWEQWYKYKDWQDQCRYPRHIVIEKLTWFIRRFWKISDYGMSTKQIIRTFLKWALVFAAVYYVWGSIDYYFMGVKDYPGVVSDLFVLEDKQEAISCSLVPFRAVYFSIVTMTTLGFGDMYANAHSFWRGLFGHSLLALQVILGYVLLAALVTRFAVLFTAGGPAGTFAKEDTRDMVVIRE